MPTNNHVFSHGGKIACPECPGVGRRQKKPLLVRCLRNYNGSYTDVGRCDECGRVWRVRFQVERLVGVKQWDGPTRAQREQSDASMRAQKQEAFSDWQYYVPKLGGGWIQCSVELPPGPSAQKHVFALIKICHNRRRLPLDTRIFPRHSEGGILLRERIKDEGLIDFGKVM